MSGVDAFGTLFKRGDGATPTEVFTTIANVTTIGGPERTRETIDVTAHDSPDGWMEFIGSLKNGGEVTLEINYDPGNATHDLDDDFEVRDPKNYQIVLLPGEADEHTWAFAGIMTQLGDEFPYDDKMARNMTVKITGKPTLTPTGS
jgi:predicted secreted protein